MAKNILDSLEQEVQEARLTVKVPEPLNNRLNAVVKELKGLKRKVDANTIVNMGLESVLDEFEKVIAKAKQSGGGH